MCISILSDHHGHPDHHHHDQVSGWCVPRELEDEPSAPVGFPLWASSGRIQDGDFFIILIGAGDD